MLDWVRWSLLITLPVLSSVAYLVCMSNGIAAGALIGLRGREADVATAQRNAMFWLSVSCLLELAFVVALYSVLKIGREATTIARYAARTIVAVLLALAITAVVGLAMFSAIQLLFPHHSIR